MSRARALVSGFLAALAAVGRRAEARSLPGPPTPFHQEPEPKPTKKVGNNRKHAPGSRAKRARWRMETASRAGNLGRYGQRRKRSQ